MPDPVAPTPILAYSGAVPNPSSPSTYGVLGRALWAWETGPLLTGANLLAAQAYTNALSANEAAVTAWINANYKGAWSGLTGALAKPALVSHAGQRWNLLNNLANVTTSTPGVSADWELFALPAASGVGFDPSGTSRTETNVQTMLTSVANDTDTALVDFENPVMNGDMRVAQSGTSFSVTTGPKTLLIDGWNYGSASPAVLTAAQVSAPTPVNANAKWLTATVTTADAAIAAGDYAFLNQPIEGHDIADYVGNTFTVSAWVISSVTGLHGICLRSGAFDRSFVGSVNIAAANTPQLATLTVPGGLPSTGTWNFTTGVGLELGFVMAAGTDFHGATGSWLSASKIAPAGQVNALATVGNVFGITDVQINPGAVAKPFKRPTYGDSLARCQDFYEQVPYFMLDADLNGDKGSMGNMGFFKRTKRGTIVLTAGVDGSLGGGDSLTLPGFVAKPGGFAQTTPGVFNAHAGQPRDGLFLIVTADRRL